MRYFKFLSLLLCIISLNAFGQNFGVNQFLNIEKYHGKEFVLEGKIYYKNSMTDRSWAVLSAVSLDNNFKTIKAPLFNDDARDYYRQDDWSSYELTGKIDKRAKFLGVGVYVAGVSSYYLDNFKLYIKEGKNRIEIPLKNSDFEKDSLADWQGYNISKNTKLSLSKDKFFSGKQSLFIDNSSLKVTPSFGDNQDHGKYMEVNGIKLYYEIYGNGEPLLLLNGNSSNMGAFSQQLEAFRKKYMVIGLDSRGQGKSTSDTTKLTYELMADDVNEFLDKMKLKHVNIMGWSDGGNIAVILAMQHPDKVNKMAIMGTVLYNNGNSVTPETNKVIHDQINEMINKGVPKSSMAYRLKMLLLTEPHINPDSLLKIQSPTLVMAGQYDAVQENHTKLIAKRIPHSKLVIFKGADHEAPAKIPVLFNETVMSFFGQK